MKHIKYTPARSVQIINKVKDSKFYGSITRADSRKSAEQFIDEISSKFHDATHNVSAFLVGDGDQAIKYADDDGEPAGSSGPPILQAIEGEGLANTVIVVTRYFGGTKLGIGGLIRAYGDTARLVIQEAGKKRLELIYKIIIGGDYDLIGTIMGQIEAHQGKIINTDYNNQGGQINVIIKPAQYKSLKENLIELTAARVKISICDKLYR